ncbi:hypothetical protein CUMW_232970 [Citrus unshiu]|uniref:Leucine-rich repeat-containing N-terminal plant-type domain-containing protein n=1 Tax=Citrus unshiu TaxID=55188 RepID=A0A2H5QIB4_CITUN|nr:hypothetical protein CUMW_232970 [Citrus unshiu]
MTSDSPFPYRLQRLSDFSGQIPPSLGNLNQLQWLDLAFNNFLCELPASIGTLSSLERLDVFCCDFSGQIPPSLGPIPALSMKIRHYLISKNNLTGEIPSWICNLSSLYVLDLSDNNLSGEPLQCLGNFSGGLSVLSLQGKNFFGTTPDTFMNGSDLRMVDLSHNLLQGKIPKSLANCAVLEISDLRNNQINDTFPIWLGSLLELNILVLIQQLPCMGKLPSKYFQCWNAMKFANSSQLRYMENFLSSYFSFDFYRYFPQNDYSITMSNKGQMMTHDKIPDILKGIILSSNRFDGEIPTSIANLKGLQVISLASNNLQGHIPPCLGSLTNLESLDLSKNRLTFLEFFNATHNNLTGPIPQANQFPAFGYSSSNGNSRLCGKPLPKESENSEPPVNEAHIEGSEALFSGASDWKIVLTGYTGRIVVGLVFGFNFSTCIVRWFPKKLGMQLKTRKRIKRHRN